MSGGAGAGSTGSKRGAWQRPVNVWQVLEAARAPAGSLPVVKAACAPCAWASLCVVGEGEGCGFVAEVLSSLGGSAKERVVLVMCARSIYVCKNNVKHVQRMSRVY